MRFLIFIFLFLQVGCATKYILPGNRFLTPESQGGAFNGQMEFQQTRANQLAADVSGGTVEDGVTTDVVNRSGFLLSTSFSEKFDFFWSHTGGGNSLLGGKFQLLGGSRSSNSVGHKLAIGAGFGGNEHETDEDPSVEFELSGQEYLLLYGYRFGPSVLAYSTFSYSRFHFDGTISSRQSSINGLKPNYESKLMSLYGGVELSAGALFGKLECGYQQIKTTETKDKSSLVLGYSVGLSW